MATTLLAFGSGDTILGLDSYPLASPGVGTRISMAAMPTASYSGNGTSGAGFKVTVTIGTPSGPGSVTGVAFLTSIAGGTATSSTGGTVTTGYQVGQGTTVTFVTSSSASLQTFLQGIYVGDTVPMGSTDNYRLTLTLNDNATGTKSFTQYYDTPAVCYLRGTSIATEQGDVTVEQLQIGDMVRTLDGSLKPVKFVGIQAFEPEFVAAAPSQRPVLIRKDAIAAGMPARDLYVSAMHSLYIDDVLVPAVALLNGRSIVRADVPGTVEYFHIELDAHEVIFAEGLPAESFIDDDSRAIFDNAFEYEALYGEGPVLSAYAPRIEEGYTVDAIRRRIATRAGVAFAAPAAPVKVIGHVERLQDGVVEGWATDEVNADTALELDILVDGESVGRTLANRYRTDLDHAGLAGGRCAFSMALPASATSLDQVQVRIAATGAELRKAAATVSAA